MSIYIIVYETTNCHQSVPQSVVQSSDSGVNQLLSIVHNLYNAFDAYPTPETGDVFLDIPEAFDKV